MAILDAVAKSLAATLVGSFGKTMTLRMVTTERDTSTGKNIETEPFGSPFTVQGVVESFPPVFNAGAQFDGTEIRPGDLKVTIPASQVTIEPLPGNTLFMPAEDATTLDEARTVKAVQKQYGGDDVYAYVLLVRR